jgi:hypothetical protein
MIGYAFEALRFEKAEVPEKGENWVISTRRNSV